MRRLLNALERAGLVEVDRPPGATQTPEQPDPPPVADGKYEAGEQASAPPPAAEAAAAERADANASATLDLQRPFDDIYAEHSLPPSPFPAERLLRVLDGLEALEPSARKTAVIALDSADDNWTVDDSLLDAERKVRVLETYRSQIEEQTRALLQQAKAQSEAREQQHQDTVARIRKQIADLEGLLERDVARASQDQSEIKAAASANKTACARELERIDAEIQRMRRIAEIFASEKPDSKT